VKRPAAGFTLIELMISLVIFSLAVAGVLAVAVSMSQTFHEQRQAIAAGDNARGAMDFIADAVRNASPAIKQAGVIRDDGTCTQLPAGGISVTNLTTGPDALTVVFASGGVVTSTRTAYSKGTTAITLTDVSNLAIGDQLLITDLTNGDIVTVVTLATTGPGNQGNITVASSSCAAFTATYAAQSLAIRVLRAKFSVGTIAGVGSNLLIMDPDDDGPLAAEPLAENIEDFQVAVGLDSTNTTNVPPIGPVNLWEYASGVGTTAGAVRALRLTLIADTLDPLQAGTTAFQRPSAEDHPNTTAAFDNIRRRVLQSTVEIRNLGGSP
jgi:prepilin-type N-terminal cleavage/methylation domain-containing protein